MSPRDFEIAIDTNVAIAFLRGQPEAIRWMESVHSPVLPIAAVAELRFGAMKSKRSSHSITAVDQLIRDSRVPSMDTETANIAAGLRLYLAQQGKPIPANDIWIAATCLQFKFPLASRDAHLSFLPGLEVFQPF